jgi:hypothetical protein
MTGAVAGQFCHALHWTATQFWDHTPREILDIMKAAKPNGDH